MTDAIEKLTAEQLLKQVTAAADAFAEAARVAAYQLAASTLPPLKRAKDEGMPVALIEAAGRASIAALDRGVKALDAAMDEAAKDLGIDLDAL